MPIIRGSTVNQHCQIGFPGLHNRKHMRPLMHSCNVAIQISIPSGIYYDAATHTEYTIGPNRQVSYIPWP